MRTLTKVEGKTKVKIFKTHAYPLVSRPYQQFVDVGTAFSLLILKLEYYIFRIRFQTKKGLNQMDTKQIEISAFIKSIGGKVTTKQVADKFNLTIVSASKTLRALIEMRRIGKEKGPKARWIISGI